MCTVGRTLAAQSGTGRVTCGRLPRSKFHKKDFVQNQLSPGIHFQSNDWDCLATSNYTGSNSPGRNSPAKNSPAKNYPGRSYPGRSYPDRNYQARSYPGRKYPGRTPPCRKSADFVLVLVLGQEVAGPQQRLLQLRPRAGPAGRLGGQPCNIACSSGRDGTIIAGGS